MNNIIYLDNGATTKPCINALNKALKYAEELYFNPSALYHGGIEVNQALNDTRNVFKKVFGDNFDVIFTSCGSESNNTAVFSYSKRGNIVTTLGEHSAIHNPFNELKMKGLDVRFAKLNNDGSVNVENLLSLIDKNTVFVSVVHVNNETGAINDINKIAKLSKEINNRIIFHSDGVQAFMKIPYNLSNDIDLYSISAHKINGLKGVGGLIKNKRVKNLKPLIYGGGQESNLRSGTENVYGIKVFEYVTLDHYQTIKDDYNAVLELKKLFIDNIDKSIFKEISTLDGSPYIICISAVGLKGEVLQHKLEEVGVIIGTGSACSSKNKHSRMLTEIGYNENILDGVIRISFSNKTTTDEVLYAVKQLNIKANELKRKMYNL